MHYCWSRRNRLRRQPRRTSTVPQVISLRCQKCITAVVPVREVRRRAADGVMDIPLRPDRTIIAGLPAVAGQRRAATGGDVSGVDVPRYR